jgi:hypothetical protein
MHDDTLSPDVTSMQHAETGIGSVNEVEESPVVLRRRLDRKDRAPNIPRSRARLSPFSLDRFPIRMNRKAIQVFDFVAFSAENRYPPRITSGASFFEKML